MEKAGNFHRLQRWAKGSRKNFWYLAFRLRNTKSNRQIFIRNITLERNMYFPYNDIAIRVGRGCGYAAHIH